MSNEAKTVWVLGSGFSKSLGGPLLKELIGPRAHDETKQIFPSLGDRSLVYNLFEKFKDTHWEHAELFLDYIDTALPSGSHRHALLTQYISQVLATWNWQGTNPTVKGLRAQAILTVAAECSTYTHGIDMSNPPEGWDPYKHWTVQRGPWDTIITFNYDQVLETVASQNGPFRRACIARPDQPIPTGMPVVLKVHGSTDWGINTNNDTFQRVDSIEDFRNNGCIPLIATPGATKSNYCKRYLKPLWEAAVNALRVADNVVFLGYRFPPSDSDARLRILGGIAGNNTANHIRVHTVLGPDVHSEATARLTGLLKHTLEGANRTPIANNGYSIVNHPLNVEDFLSVATHQTLRR